MFLFGKLCLLKTLKIYSYDRQLKLIYFKTINLYFIFPQQKQSYFCHVKFSKSIIKLDVKNLMKKKNKVFMYNRFTKI